MSVAKKITAGGCREMSDPKSQRGVELDLSNSFFPSLDEALEILTASRGGRVLAVSEVVRVADEVARALLGPNSDLHLAITLSRLLIGISFDSHRRGYEEGLEEAAQTVQLISGEELLGYVKTIRREKAGEAMTSPRSVCAWEQDEEGNWETGCGGMWTLMEGTPAENEMKFCPRCGGKLEFTEHKEEPC